MNDKKCWDFGFRTFIISNIYNKTYYRIYYRVCYKDKAYYRIYYGVCYRDKAYYRIYYGVCYKDKAYYRIYYRVYYKDKVYYRTYYRIKKSRWTYRNLSKVHLDFLIFYFAKYLIPVVRALFFITIEPCSFNFCIKVSENGEFLANSEM